MRSVFFDGTDSDENVPTRTTMGNMRIKIKVKREVTTTTTASTSTSTARRLEKGKEKAGSSSTAKIEKAARVAKAVKSQRRRKERSVRGLQSLSMMKANLRTVGSGFVEVIDLEDMDHLDRLDDVHDDRETSEPVVMDGLDEERLEEHDLEEVSLYDVGAEEEMFDSVVAEYGEMEDGGYDDDDVGDDNLFGDEDPYVGEEMDVYAEPPLQEDVFGTCRSNLFNIAMPEKLYFGYPEVVEDDPGHMTLGPDDAAKYSDVYQTLGPLGEGTYGVVNKARNRASRQIVAVKKLRIEEDGEKEGIPCTSLREVSLLKELRHEHIVRLLDVMVETERYYKMYLVFEFVGKDLSQYLKDLKAQGTPITPVMAKKFSYQLLLGLRYCHGRRIIHRDLKPSNLLITFTTHNLKIADFGLSRAVSVPPRIYTHRIVTLWYRPPELLFGVQRYSMGVDMWSAGTILGELGRRGEHLFTGDSEIGQIFSIFRILGTPTLETWPQIADLSDFKPTFPQWTPRDLSTVLPALDSSGIDLVRNMLDYDASKRISAKRALLHPYYEDVMLEATP